MQSTTLWHGSIAAVVLAAGLLSGCQNLSPQPTPAASTLSGNWQMDPTASDNFDQKLLPLVQEVRRLEQPRMTQPGDPAAGRGPRIDPLVMPPEDPSKLRTRLGDDLRPAANLRIALVGEGVEITRDAEPTRQFLPSQSVSRIDSSGGYRLDCGWDQRAFVIHAKYTNHGARSWRLEHDAATDTLKVTFQASNPEYGHLELHTLYRRGTGATP
jgi:hypothetical protein